MRALKITDEIRDALADRRPVVALETTIVTHGMPYPDNIRHGAVTRTGNPSRRRRARHHRRHGRRDPRGPVGIRT